ncbi:SDR family oxidoreductase [Chromobacterium subtsugae]|uniref:SDR family oxidoreductase n=1 Tax=Chromobacterium subtsugae TaxID=251747 RepID=A0ABS7FBR0_9NEIS|nr:MULTISPECIES: SDR family oxidoreductase [Chromobacterium]KUM03006.1 short-chain dehydrogenase [Chromobacterium subtsugae]KZE85965.1 NAD(P)-dependent oxidoreductase [Chromobacterium sp. F49]MBW7567338.1 SDR family oxidoreductase [Chromobacterium subtsugae]MBW8287504.1 SDR family oxidoreductase [Chromobacterium subtsugae]WSE93460.1 SDR family oxidoreductase [Chromobacterium subtsugae]
MKTEFAKDALAGRVILVTGASQGIGREAALTFARHGAAVVLLARSVKGLEKVYDEVVATGAPEPAAAPLDLLNAGENEFGNLALTIQREFGRLDGILHCASHFYALSPLSNQTIEEWMNQYRINTVAPFALTRACLPLLKAAPDASVLFVGESHGLHPAAYWGGFGASNAGLPYLTKVAASEWEMHANLRVNLLTPGPVNSPQRNRTHPGEAKSERGELADLMPHLLYWLGGDSRGRSGEVVELDLRKPQS